LSADPVVFDKITRRGRERGRKIWTGVKVSGCTPEQIDQARIAGYEPGSGDAAGTFVGRDPREMTQDELRAMGHEPMSVIQALRLKCVDCVGGSANEVRLCVEMACASWSFRMGPNPWRAPPCEARREAARENIRRMHSQRALRGQQSD
jgi:hypothetical protein